MTLILGCLHGFLYIFVCHCRRQLDCFLPAGFIFVPFFPIAYDIVLLFYFVFYFMIFFFFFHFFFSSISHIVIVLLGLVIVLSFSFYISIDIIKNEFL